MERAISGLSPSARGRAMMERMLLMVDTGAVETCRVYGRFDMRDACNELITPLKLFIIAVKVCVKRTALSNGVRRRAA